jgi:acyl dehydratase
MKIADFYPGQIIHAGSYRVKAAEILLFARAYDRQWFHMDEQAATSGPFGGLIASGWHTCAIAMRILSEGLLHQSESCMCRWASSRFAGRIRCGPMTC